MSNKALIFSSVPTGYPIPGKDLTVETRPFDPSAPPPQGGLTVQSHYASFDPYMRGRMRAPTSASYNAPFTLGDPLATLSIVRVLKSDSPAYAPGDLLVGLFPIQEFSAVPMESITARGGEPRKLDNPYGVDTRYYLGALGMPGLTAYSSLYEIGKPKRGETIFISAASGAVGQLVGQLAKHEGLRVVGSVGSEEKLEFILKELGFDAGFNYKKETAAEALTRCAPNGVDIYYENVGGEQLESAIGAMNQFGRIVACGMISQYNLPAPQLYGVKNLMMVVQKRLTMRGFIVSDPDMGPKYYVDLHKNVAKWLHEGSFKASQSLTEGIDNAPEGFVGMLKGENFGKAVLVVKELE